MPMGELIPTGASSSFHSAHIKESLILFLEVLESIRRGGLRSLTADIVQAMCIMFGWWFWQLGVIRFSNLIHIPTSPTHENRGKKTNKPTFKQSKKLYVLVKTWNLSSTCCQGNLSLLFLSSCLSASVSRNKWHWKSVLVQGMIWTWFIYMYIQ